MNRICVFKKMVVSCFASIFFAMVGLLLKDVGYNGVVTNSLFVVSIYFLFFVISNIFIKDLCLESKKLVFISLFIIQEIELETLNIVSIEVTRIGPRFKVITKDKNYYCFYTEDNYEVLKKLILMNKVNTTLEELDRMVKYSVLPIKRRKKNS